jgi:hypothetical protein
VAAAETASEELGCRFPPFSGQVIPRPVFQNEGSWSAAVLLQLPVHRNLGRATNSNAFLHLIKSNLEIARN